ncbi:MAG: SAM-dependent chlorinase/fluorinase [Desulfobacterota bacterium]|nr:SAM-dependent chlorinase/fluorinase [Thermodesulfobacteriota bacterium]
MKAFRHPIVTLLTDFGTKDPYVASMKGVILGINPRCQVVDITHQIAPQDVVEGAFVLSNAFSYFPEGTVHVAVVDPEVGGKRHPVLIVTERYFFVGPDNGLFGFVLRKERMKEAYILTEKRFFLPRVSSTFHGRDIFSPVAGHLTLGVPPKAFGREAHSLKDLGFPVPQQRGRTLTGEVIHVDRFGNLITNIDRATLLDFSGGGPIRLSVSKRKIEGIRTSYWEGKKGELMALFGSSDLLEIAVREGSAQERLKGRRGDPVRIVPVGQR